MRFVLTWVKTATCSFVSSTVALPHSTKPPVSQIVSDVPLWSGQWKAWKGGLQLAENYPDFTGIRNSVLLLFCKGRKCNWNLQILSSPLCVWELGEVWVVKHNCQWDVIMYWEKNYMFRSMVAIVRTTWENLKTICKLHRVHNVQISTCLISKVWQDTNKTNQN